MPTEPKKKAPLRIPLVVQPASMYGTLFEPADVSILASSAAIPLHANADVVEIARRLNDVATHFVLASQALATAPSGELASWCREFADRAEAFLGAFSSASDWTDPVAAAARVLQGPAGFIDGHGLPLDARPEIEAARKAVATLARRALLAAAEYEKSKGAKRKSPDIEVEFYRQLGSIYEAAFGEKWTLSTAKGGQRGGGGVRFCKVVGEHLAARHADASPRGEDAAAALRRLQHANSSADRIRDTRSGGKVRKR